MSSPLIEEFLATVEYTPKQSTRLNSVKVCCIKHKVCCIKHRNATTATHYVHMQKGRT